MRRFTALAIGLFVLGLVLLSYSVYSGEANVYIFVIIPVFQSSSAWAFAGMACIILAIFLFFYSYAAEPGPASGVGHQGAPMGKAPAPARKKFGGVVFVGPIPIIFGSDKKIAKWMIVLALVVVVLLLVLLLYFGTGLFR